MSGAAALTRVRCLLVGIRRSMSAPQPPRTRRTVRPSRSSRDMASSEVYLSAQPGVMVHIVGWRRCPRDGHRSCYR
eukprot:53556-Eustigmatos_ZCMA.PRE.1